MTRKMMKRSMKKSLGPILLSELHCLLILVVWELPGVCGFSRVASFLLMISKFSWFPVHEVFVVGGFEGFDGCFDFSGSTFRVPELLESRQWLSSGVCTFAWGSGVVG